MEEEEFGEEGHDVPSDLIELYVAIEAHNAGLI